MSGYVPREHSPRSDCPVLPGNDSSKLLQRTRVSFFTIVRLAGCWVSIAWLLFVHMSAIIVGGFPSIPFEAKILDGIVLSMGALPVALSLHGRRGFFLGVPYMFVTIATLGILWRNLWTIPISLKIPPNL